MIDYGLLVSMIVAFGLPTLLSRRWPMSTFDPPAGFVDAVTGAVLVGLVVGRLATLALDDPRSIGRLADMLVVRSGVEFWPGVAAAAGYAAFGAQRKGVSPLARLAAIAPLSMVGYAGYEAACLVRDGCYGPASPIGLRPRGISATILPIGVLMALFVAGAAIVVHRRSATGATAHGVVVAAIAAVASARAVGSFWLPKIGEALTRQHRSSLLVALVTVPTALVLARAPAARPKAVGPA